MNHATMPLAQIESLLASPRIEVVWFPDSDTKRREHGCRCHIEEGDSPCPVHDAEFDRWMARTAAECRNCPNCGNPPCDACQAGGICDEADCYCGDAMFDEPEEAQSSAALDAEGEPP